MKHPPPTSSALPRQPTSFLFLASHGLLSPLSAIRWGCSRLRRSVTEEMSGEQQKLVQHVEYNSAVLSKILGSLLMLTRMEDHTYTSVLEPLHLRPYLDAEVREWERLQGAPIALVCDPDITVIGDSAVLTNALQNLFAVFFEEQSQRKTLDVFCEVREKQVRITLTGLMQVPFLQYVQTLQLEPEVRSVVGGTAGLFLSIANSLLEHLDGTLDMREAGEGAYIVAATLPSMER